MFSRGWTPNFGWRTGSRNRFTPLRLTNLRAWYRADLGVTIATGVSQWADQSGNGNHLVQAVGGSQPTVSANALNGQPMITFVNKFMVSTFTMNQPETIFAVIRQTAWSLNNFIYDGTTDLTVRLVQSAVTPELVGSADLLLAPDANLGIGTAGLSTFIVNGASSVYQVNSLTEVAGDAGADVAGGITLGARATGLNNASFQIAELIIMAAVATATERASVRAYSQARYGVGS